MYGTGGGGGGGGKLNIGSLIGATMGGGGLGALVGELMSGPQVA